MADLGSIHFLNTGELLFSTQPCRVRTILGSCVGVAIRDLRRGTGGLCHYLLARSGNGQQSTRYGEVAIPMLVKKFLVHGSQPGDLQAWIVGGARLNVDSSFHVGRHNIDLAHDILKSFRVAIVEDATGGDRGRELLFDTGLGTVQIRPIQSSNISTVLEKNSVRRLFLAKDAG